MKRIALFVLFMTTVYAFGQRPSPQASQSYVTGRFVAFNYGQWKSPIYSLSAPTGSNVQVTLVNAYVRLPDGRQVTPYNTNAPLLIGRETVTPSAVSNCRIGEQSQNTCIVTVTLALNHDVSEMVSSGTFGLQEALNDAGLIGGSVTVDGSWAAAGGTSGMISGAVIPANVKIEDCRTGCPSGSGSGTVNPGQLALAQYPTSSAPSVSPSNVTYDAATGNNLTFGATGSGNAYLGSSIAGSYPVLDIRHPSFAGGAICDGTNTNDIAPALQVAWNALTSTGGRIIIPGLPNNCWWANPNTFTWTPNGRPITILIQGQLRTGTTLHIPRGVTVNIQGLNGASYTQFQGPGDAAQIFERPSNNSPAVGTLGTAITVNFTGSGNPTATVPTACNSSTGAGTTYQDTNAAVSPMFTCAVTQGSITSGTNTLTVTTAGGFIVGDSLSITGAGTSGGTLNTSITAISGTTYTLAANASTTSLTATVTNTIQSVTAGWRPGAIATFTPSNMKGLFNGTGITIAETQNCTISTISRASNVVTLTTTGTCRIPSGIPITVAGVTDSSFNGTYAGGNNPQSFLLRSSDRVTGIFTYRQVAADASSSGGTLTGFDEDSLESVNLSNCTSTTCVAPFFKLHSSTSQWGVVGVEVDTTNPANLKDLVITADGTALWMFWTNFSILDRIGIGSVQACNGTYVNQALELNYAGFITMNNSSIQASCQPWSIHALQYENYGGFTSNGPLFMNYTATFGGVKLDQGGVGIHWNHGVCEQCARGAVVNDPTNDWNPNPTRIFIHDLLIQDNPNNFSTCALYQNQPIFPTGLGATGIAQINFMSGFTACTVNDYFQGSLQSNPGVSPQYGLTTQKGIYGTFNNGQVIDGEIRGAGANLSPSIIPHATEAVTTDPTAWSGPCTVASTSILAPDGSNTAGQLTLASSSNQMIVGSKTITPAVGDHILFGAWVQTPTVGQKAASGPTGSAVVVDNNSSTHFQIDQGNSGTTNQWDALIVNDWWHPVVGLSTVTQSDGTAGQSVKIRLNCSSTLSMNYWMPFMIYVPASENVPLVTLNRWKAQLLHGAVPANMPAGGAILAMKQEHKMYWGSDTNLYRGAAGVVKTDGSFNVASGQTYQINGTQIATGNLGDWTNSGVANGNVPVWNSGTGKWTPGTGAAGGTVTSSGTMVANHPACWSANGSPSTNLIDCSPVPAPFRTPALVEQVFPVFSGSPAGMGGCASQGVATGTSANSTSPTLITLTSGASSGNCAGLWTGSSSTPNPSYYQGRSPTVNWSIGFSASADYTTSARVWVGLIGSACTTATMTGSDTPACSYGAIRSSTSASDATWVCVSDSGTGTPQVQAIGSVTPTTAYQVMSVSIATGAVTCTVGATSVTNSSTVPSNQSFYDLFSNTTLTNAATHIRYGTILGYSANGSF